VTSPTSPGGGVEEELCHQWQVSGALGEFVMDHMMTAADSRNKFVRMGAPVTVAPHGKANKVQT
jgi:hypothetical protein